MEKKLPKVFANNAKKEFNNNEKVFYSKDGETREVSPKKHNDKNIYQKLNEIFSSERYVYKADVEIKTRSGNKKTKLIGQNNTHVITIDNELIPITDIDDINLLN